MPARKDRKGQVEELLKRGTDEKVVLSGHKRALEFLSKAYQLAKKDPELEHPWPQRAAYHLAHLRMKDTNGSISDLVEIAALFTEAAKARSLSCWPLLYKLAVLQRIRALDPPQILDHELNKWLKAAVASVRSSLTRDDSEDPLQLHNTLYNALELTSYFCGEPIHELDSLRAAIVRPQVNWVVCGPDPKLAEVHVSRDYAFEAAESLTKAHPGSFTFCFHGVGKPRLGPGLSGLCLKPSQESKEIEDRDARILAWMLKVDPSVKDWGDVQDKLAISSAYLRTTRSRFRHRIKELTGIQLPSGTESFDLPETPAIFGVVHLPRLTGTRSS